MDAVFAFVNFIICVFSFIKGVGYIRDSTKTKDAWWQFHAVMIAIATVGIMINIYIISKILKPPVPVAPAAPAVSTGAVGPNPEFASLEQSLNQQAAAAAEQAKLLAQKAASLRAIG